MSSEPVSKAHQYAEISEAPAVTAHRHQQFGPKPGILTTPPRLDWLEANSGVDTILAIDNRHYDLVARDRAIDHQLNGIKVKRTEYAPIVSMGSDEEVYKLLTIIRTNEADAGREWSILGHRRATDDMTASRCDAPWLQHR